MKEEEQIDKSSILVLINCIIGGLFLLSEILGMSSCEYNGVIHFIIGGCLCNKKVYVDISVREHEEESVSLISDEV